jgi:hypothetical protein
MIYWCFKFSLKSTRNNTIFNKNVSCIINTVLMQILFFLRFWNTIMHLYIEKKIYYSIKPLKHQNFIYRKFIYGKFICNISDITVLPLHRYRTLSKVLTDRVAWTSGRSDPFSGAMSIKFLLRIMQLNRRQLAVNGTKYALNRTLPCMKFRCKKDDPLYLQIIPFHAEFVLLHTTVKNFLTLFNAYFWFSGIYRTKWNNSVFVGKAEVKWLLACGSPCDIYRKILSYFLRPFPFLNVVVKSPKCVAVLLLLLNSRFIILLLLLLLPISRFISLLLLLLSYCYCQLHVL